MKSKVKRPIREKSTALKAEFEKNSPSSTRKKEVPKVPDYVYIPYIMKKTGDRKILQRRKPCLKKN
jgi:hypothetical protein